MPIIILAIVGVILAILEEFTVPPEGACCGDCIYWSHLSRRDPPLCDCSGLIRWDNHPACPRYVKRKVKEKGN